MLKQFFAATILTSALALAPFAALAEPAPAAPMAEPTGMEHHHHHDDGDRYHHHHHHHHHHHYDDHGHD